MTYLENILITMNNNGDLTCADPNGGYIEEMKARQLVISVNSFFRSSVISYFTVSFEPYGLGKKIVTDNIYKSENIGEVTYDPVNGTIICPIFDYISVSPKVSIQIDGYETDENSDICAIYKSGVLDLNFSESLVGEIIVPNMTNAEQKLSERISQMIDDELDSIVISADTIANGAVTSEKIGSKEVKTGNIDDLAVTRAKIADKAINTSKLNDNAVSSDKINGRAVTLGKIAEDAVTSYELADGAVKESNIASSQVSNSKISSGAVTSGKIYSGNDHSQRIQPSNIADGAVREAQLYSQSVSTSKIKDKAVTLDKIANDVKAYYHPFGALSKKEINFISYSHTNGSPCTINTQEEYIYNCKQGYNSIKGDLRLTSDGKIVMCHDAGFTFDSNGKIISYNENNCTLIHNMTYDECMSKQYADGSNVCDFETYIEICKKYGKFAFFDLRHEYLEDTIAEMLMIINKYQMKSNCVVACANITPATTVRNADKEIMISLTVGRSDAAGDYGVKYYVDRAAALGNVICFGFDFPLSGDNGARHGVLALDETFDDGDGNMLTAPDYAGKLGIPYYECVIETNTETYDVDGTPTQLNVIDECIKRGVTGFVTEAALPDFAKKNLSGLVQDSTHRTVTDSEKTAWNGKVNASDLSNYYTKTQADEKYVAYSDGMFEGDSRGIRIVSSDASFDINLEDGDGNGTVDVPRFTLNYSVHDNESDEDLFCTDLYFLPVANDTNNIDTPHTILTTQYIDSDHRFVTDSEKTAWNGKANVSDIPTNNNQLTNGAGYQTASDVSTAIAGNQFVATYSKNSSNQWVCDKTFAEIEAAITAKKEVIAVTNDDFVGLPLKTYYTLEFYAPNAGVGFTNVGSLTGVSGSYSVRLLSHISEQGASETIGVEYVEVNLNLKENVANKVTTIDTSSPSTTEYPSESAVVSYVSGILGGINTVLDSINGEVI